MRRIIIFTKCVSIVAIICLMINTKLLAQNSIWILPPYYTNAASITNQLTPLPIPIGLGTDLAICYQG